MPDAESALWCVRGGNREMSRAVLNLEDCSASWREKEWSWEEHGVRRGARSK